MKTITFSAIKGGVGKSSLAILTANILAAAGKKVLCVDADPQNSMTFYYLPDNADIKENLANVFSGQSIQDNIVKSTGYKSIDIVPSSLELIEKRNDNVNILISALAGLQKEYDYCIIDTAPNFDNVVINCLGASDIIITPVQFSLFDFKSAIFYHGLLSNMDIADKWKVVFNKFKPVRTGTSFSAKYLEIYTNTFKNHILKSRIPESSVIKQYFDTSGSITKAKNKVQVFNVITELASEITLKKLTVEAF